MSFEEFKRATIEGHQCYIGSNDVGFQRIDLRITTFEEAFSIAGENVRVCADYWNERVSFSTYIRTISRKKIQ